MDFTSPHASAHTLPTYQQVLQDAAARGSLLMGLLASAARSALQLREAASRDVRERDALMQSAKLLREWESELCKRFPQGLLDAFANPDLTAPKATTRNLGDVQFDELELMDEVQVQTSVVFARTQQVVMQAAESSLSELNPLICGMLGLGAVYAERNPLRPQIYIHALKSVIEQTRVPTAMQLDWLGAMSLTLGQELHALYTRLCIQLKSQGVVATGFTVTQVARGPGIGRGVAQTFASAHGAESAGHFVSSAATRVDGGAAEVSASRPRASEAVSATHDTLLTLDKLRRLLVGELDGSSQLSPLESFARRFEREFEGESPLVDGPQTNFDATVPAALEALQEMQQVDHVVQRLEQRKGFHFNSERREGTSLDADRAALRQEATGVAQALSLEVVTLMVDNLARDARLLMPVQNWIRHMEPALARLALADPRLFSNKSHPARLLVQEVMHHSMAYASVQASGFAEFLQGVQQAVAPLMNGPIENAEPFSQILNQLQVHWTQDAQRSARKREDAVKALENAEQRNVLAEKIARQIASHPDASQVPSVVIDFLCGPWAQVVAQARIAGGVGSGAADKYQALISALLWSAHPVLTQKNTAKLTRLVPLLLGTLRDGLDTIHYPPLKTSAFLEVLMGLHQQAFRANQRHTDAPAPPQAAPAAPEPVNRRANLLEDGNPWLAPDEAQASNFMDLPESPVAVAPAPDNGVGNAEDLPLGSWVELLVGDQWVRTQLTWASPHGTLFLFTSILGATQSMTRRSRDKLVAAGNLRVVSSQPLVDGALDAVAQQAMRNSVGNSF